LDPDRLIPNTNTDTREHGWESARSTLLILLTFAVGQGYIHFQYCVLPEVDSEMISHHLLLSGKDFGPFIYRPLVPCATEFLIRCLSVLFAYEKAFKVAYMLWCMLAMSTTVVGSWLYFRSWFSEGLAVAGALLVGSSVTVLMSYESYMSHWSMIEPGFWALGFWCMDQNRKGLLAAVIVLATINRETSCFIVLAYALSNTDILWRRSDDTIYARRKWAIIYGLCWLLTYGFIRVWQGHALHVVTLEIILRMNLELHSWPYFLRQLGFAFSFFWVLAVLGARSAPTQVLNTCRVIPFYLAVVAVFGRWEEVRLFAPLSPLVIALGLSYMERRT
jgi:hypothetical protein